MTEPTVRPASLPPRWFIRAAWAIHRFLFRASGGRIGLRPATPKEWGMMRLTTVAAVVQAAILALVALVVLSAAGVVLSALADSAPWLAWVPVAISGVAVVLNAATPSAGERRVWLPVTLVLLASSLVVALG